MLEQDIEKIMDLVSEREKAAGIAAISVGEDIYGIVVVVEGKTVLRKMFIEIRDRRVPLVIISKTILLGDAYFDFLGGYVSSYLLFPLKIIYDSGVLGKTVTDLRRRIVDEEISLLASYGKILSYAVIPLEYFPLKALSIRVKLYSTPRMIAETLFRVIGFEGIRSILRGEYREIIDLIVKSNRLELVGGDYVRLTERVLSEPGYKKYIPRIKEKISPIAMSIASFLVDERVSDTSYRGMPLEFLKPHLLVKMREGILGIGDWRELLEIKYGRVEREGRLSIVYSTEIYRVDNSKVVVKQYTSPSNIKWVLASIASVLSKKFIVSSWERQYNEYHASILLASKGFPHRRVVIVDPISAVTVFEYIEGTPIITLARERHRLSGIAYRMTGELLGRLHLNGIVMGDTKPDNYILTCTENPFIVPIDLEQARETRSIEEQAWDIAMFVYFHGMGYSKVPDNYIELLRTFLTGYVDTIKNKSIVAEASRLKYQLPFMYIVPVHNLVQLNSVLKDFIRDTSVVV